MKYLIVLVALCVLIAGCSSETEKEEGTKVYETFEKGNPTAQEVLIEKTDIFLLNDVVYVNAEDIDWVKQRDLTLGSVVLEITKQSDTDFTNGTASKLPIGTKIYKPLEKGDIYIAVVNGKEIRYLGWREG